MTEELLMDYCVKCKVRLMGKKCPSTCPGCELESLTEVENDNREK